MGTFEDGTLRTSRFYTTGPVSTENGWERSDGPGICSEPSAAVRQLAVIRKAVTARANYRPPHSYQHLLGPVARIFADGRVVQLHQAFKGATFVGTLPAGQLFFESNLELDDDGSIYHTQDEDGKKGTSLSASNGKGIDANAVPYIVLPKNSFGHWGIQLGDMAVVFWNGRMSPAIFADHGPEGQLGEGSVELHRRLGHETIHSGQLENKGVPPPRALTFVFPRSGNRHARPVKAIEVIATRCWHQLQQQ